VVDDGSDDNTAELVKTWQEAANGFEIQYLYQKNQGLHVAHNLAYKSIETELNICIDSDDFMPERAVAQILEFWEQYGDESAAGIIGHNTYSDGTVIGAPLPRDKKRITLFELYNSRKVKGAKKMVYRTELTGQAPYPRFGNEKYYPLEYKYFLLDKSYDLIMMHDPICRVEKMPDSVVLNIVNEYFKNTQGFISWFAFLMSMPKGSRSFKFSCAVKYVAACIIGKNKNWLHETTEKRYVIPAVPLGCARYLFLRLAQRLGLRGKM
jgi:glycosyltransferase involved in cell wall biosynthesis